RGGVLNTRPQAPRAATGGRGGGRTAALMTAVLFALSAGTLAGTDTAELEFTHAVERFVMTAEPDRRPPEPWRTLLEDLGNDCWRYRDAAQKRIERTARADPRWLFWGRYDFDPEIRLRSNRALKRLFICRTCGGAGFCTAFIPGPDKADVCDRCGRLAWWHSVEDAQACRGCKGHGSA